MTYEEQSGTSSLAEPESVRFVELSCSALGALLDGDLARASAEAGVVLDEYFLEDRMKQVWWSRINQIAAGTATPRWLTRAAVAEPEGVVVGYGGFHGPPSPAGTVELGYSVAPAHRRRGCARAMLTELMRQAAAEVAVRTVRVTISPENTASLATISGFGFVEVGEQWDDEDGLELVFEVAV